MPPPSNSSRPGTPVSKQWMCVLVFTLAFPMYLVVIVTSLKTTAHLRPTPAMSLHRDRIASGSTAQSYENARTRPARPKYASTNIARTPMLVCVRYCVAQGLGLPLEACASLNRVGMSWEKSRQYIFLKNATGRESADMGAARCTSMLRRLAFMMPDKLRNSFKSVRIPTSEFPQRDRP